MGGTELVSGVHVQEILPTEVVEDLFLAGFDGSRGRIEVGLQLADDSGHSRALHEEVGRDGFWVGGVVEGGVGVDEGDDGEDWGFDFAGEI
jgi:hypothetical protein